MSPQLVKSLFFVSLETIIFEWMWIINHYAIGLYRNVCSKNFIIFQSTYDKLKPAFEFHNILY